jgi:dCMP deaminase
MLRTLKINKDIKRQTHGDISFMTDTFLSFPFWRIKMDEFGKFEVFYSEKELSELTFGVEKKDSIYLEMASVWAKNSYCSRMQVGCLIVKNKSIISDGYNGSPTGFPNICESDENETLPYVLHAEANAITKLAKGTQSSDGSTLYVTLSPCFECSKLIIQSGIKKVIFSEVYRKPESLSFLVEGGIEIIKFSNNQIKIQN